MKLLQYRWYFTYRCWCDEYPLLLLHCRFLPLEGWTSSSTVKEGPTRRHTLTTGIRMPTLTFCGLTRCRWLQLTMPLKKALLVTKVNLGAGSLLCSSCAL